MFQILIVEDDKELSQLFQKVLEKNGYQVKGNRRTYLKAHFAFFYHFFFFVYQRIDWFAFV